jgi:uncharacterized membrane protein
MKNKINLIKSAITSILTITTASSLLATTSALAEPQTEKCYGIVKAGLNDCHTKNQSCAGSATKDKQGDAFIMLPKGTCTKIVDASLTPIPEKNSK